MKRKKDGIFLRIKGNTVVILLILSLIGFIVLCNVAGIAILSNNANDENIFIQIIKIIALTSLLGIDLFTFLVAMNEIVKKIQNKK